MKNHQLFVVLVVLILSTSFNLSRCSVEDDIEYNRDGQKIKTNDRRAGLVPFPRIGRNSEIENFPRSDRAAGLLHYPRVGRSDSQTSSMNFNRYHDAISDDEIYNAQDVDLDSTLDQNFEGYPGRPLNLKQVDKILKDALSVPDYIHTIKEYRPAQKIKDYRSQYPNIRGSRYNQGQLSVNGYTPRLGREPDHDVVMSFL